MISDWIYPIPMRALFVAEKNDAAKSIAAILSRGTSTRRDGRSRFNKIYQFTANIGRKLFLIL